VDGTETVARHSFEAPIVGDSGANLPALLGLKSLREKGAILVLSPRDEDLKLILPAEGGADIELSPGSVTYPLAVAPSGHLLLRCDMFEGHQRISLPSRSSTFPVMRQYGSVVGDEDLTPVPDAHVAAAQRNFVHGLATTGGEMGIPGNPTPSESRAYIEASRPRPTARDRSRSPEREG
jgi:hypothetical protein